MGVVLVQTEYSKKYILYISTSYILTTTVVLYIFNVINSLSNYISTNFKQKLSNCLIVTDLVLSELRLLRRDIREVMDSIEPVKPWDER